ncbi:MAG: hypothetical protein JRI56_07985 [Deltaproteobacteria bacterium]|nr:hypothetical protein [Deltaproteobacteria bacterium]
MREQGVETAEKVIGQLKQYPVELIDADQKLIYEAAKLKGRYKIAYADCFAAALVTLNLRSSAANIRFNGLTLNKNIPFSHGFMGSEVQGSPKS